MKELCVKILRVGIDKDTKQPVLVKTNDISVLYETGCLRYIRSGNVEILRMIYPAIRDRNWGTILPFIRNEKIVQEKDHFNIKYLAEYKQGDIHFVAEYMIRGHDNRITFEMKGEALSDFFKNRIGLCVLHPLSVSGKTCILHHTDGKKSGKSFPEFISPHQPFMDITKMEWEYIAGGKAVLEFSGDVFETEDQRNWTDASFKTYSTPLSLPFPVKVEAGFDMEQSVSLTVKPVIHTKIIGAGINEIQIPAKTGKRIKLPEIGICASGEYRGFTEDERNIFRQLNFSHYRIEISLDAINWEQKLEEEVREACLLDKPVELVFCLHKLEEIKGKKIKEIISRNKCRLYSIACFHPERYFTTDFILDTIYPLLRKIFPGIPLGAGSNTNFAELNRNRFKANKADIVTFPVCPQVHATDHLTLVENLEGQKHAVENAICFYPDIPVHVSPVTLKRRPKPITSRNDQYSVKNSLPGPVDPRQMSLFCAGWTMGSMKMLGEAAASSVTFYETIGMKGIIFGHRSPQYPDQFHALPNMIYPVWHLLREILLHKDWEIIPVPQTTPVSTCVLTLEHNHNRFIIVSNLKQENNYVKIGNLPQQISIFNMDENTYPDLMAHTQNFQYAIKDTVNGMIELDMKPCGLSFIKYSQ